MGDMGDNVAIFRFLSAQLPDEHITNCIDAHVISETSTALDDPENPGRRLISLGYVLTCPHVHRFEISMHVTVERPPG